MEDRAGEKRYDDAVSLWEDVRQELKKSNCLKTNTAAAVVKEMRVLSFGHNSCAPKGHKYSDKLHDCPREKIKTGTDYELCSPVHAEVTACLNIRKERNPDELGRYASHLELSDDGILSAFTAEELEQLRGSSLYLVGHYWVCKACLKFLNAVGISEIKFDDISGEETKSKYLDNGLTK